MKNDREQSTNCHNDSSYALIMSTRWVTLMLVVMLMLLPSIKGLSITYFEYAIQAGQAACGIHQYHSEPIFLLILWVASNVVNLLLASGCDFYEGPLLAVPLALSFIGILVIGYVLSSMGSYALMFTTFIVLDGANGMLPFHLLRQFIAFIIFALAFYFVLNKKWDKASLLWASLFSALVHFSGWLYVLIVVFALFLSEWSGRLSTRGGREPFAIKNHWLVVAVVCSVILFFFYIFEYLSIKLGGNLLYPFGAIVKMVGNGSGLVFLGKQFFLLGALWVLFVLEKSLFLSRIYFAFLCAYVTVLAIGFDTSIVNRMQIMILPLAYLAFLVALSRNKLSVKAEVCNAIFLTLVFGTYFFDAKELKFIEPSGMMNFNFFN